MKINSDKHYSRSNTSFGLLKEVKYLGLFDKQGCTADLLAFSAVMKSKAFQYLFENRDVWISFDKNYRAKEREMYTVFRYAYKPLEDKTKPLLKRVLNKLKHRFLYDDVKKSEWMEGWERKITKESDPLYKKIKKITVQDMQKLIERQDGKMNYKS